MTILVGGLSKNYSVLYMPRLDSDRLASLQNLQKEIQSIRNDPPVSSSSSSIIKPGSTVRRTLATVNKHTKLSSSSSSSSASSSAAAAAAAANAANYTEQDIREALRLMSDKWDRQVALMQKYLQRNYHLVNGIRDGTDSIMERQDEEEGRPTTGRSSFSGMLEKAALDRTPTMEEDDGLANAAGYGTTPYPYGGGMLGGMNGANGTIGAGAGAYGMNGGGGRYSEDRRYDSSRPTTATTLTGSSTATITTNGSRPTTATLTGSAAPSIGAASGTGNGAAVGQEQGPGKGKGPSGSSPRKGSHAGTGTGIRRKELHI